MLSHSNKVDLDLRIYTTLDLTWCKKDHLFAKKYVLLKVFFLQIGSPFKFKELG